MFNRKCADYECIGHCHRLLRDSGELVEAVGEVPFYHRNGKCYYRKRSHSRYPGTAAQTSALDVHRRAMAAWREVPHQTQLVWNRLAEEVEPHRPPFDHLAHITGQNLFVSAYHGFATLGSEHAPVPVPFEKFPPFAVSLGDAVKMNGSLVIPARFVLIDTETGYRSQYQEYAAPLNAL